MGKRMPESSCVLAVGVEFLCSERGSQPHKKFPNHITKRPMSDMDRRKCVTPTRLATWFEDATLAGNRDEQPGVGWSALHCPPCLHCVTDQARPNCHAFWCRSVPGCQQSRGRGLIADCCTLKEFGLCISTSLRNNNTISTAFKVLVPVFLFWR